MSEFDTPVLIVGAGPVGLALALDLAKRGTRSLIVDEGRDNQAALPAKAGTLNERTLELCNIWGVADAVSNWGAPDDYPRDTVYCTALVGGYPVGRSVQPATSGRKPNESPQILRKCPQYIFDPILERAALATGLVELRRGLRFQSLEQNSDHVVVTVKDVASGVESTLTAAYVAGCDGAGSSVRRALGIDFEGKTLDYSMTIVTEIEALEQYHEFGRAERFMFLGPNGTWCNATSMDYGVYWRFTLLNRDTPWDPADVDAESVVIKAMGTSEIPFKVLGKAPWRRSQCTAATFNKGRVILAGDSAHTTSPTGGHGLNTGLGDALAAGWMLNALVQGWGGPELLEAYTAERRPIAIRNSSRSTRNYRAWIDSVDYSEVYRPGPEGDAIRAELGRKLGESLSGEWKSPGVALGYRYDGSPLIIDDGSPATEDADDVYLPTARPGHLAPHVWLASGQSVIDHFGRGFVLMRIGGAQSDVSALSAAAKACGAPLEVLDINEPAVAKAYESSLVLVRPDGHVAWRGDQLPADCEGLIDTLRGMRKAA